MARRLTDYGDRFGADNPVHEAMRQESRDALRVTEMQRFTSCTHTYNTRGVCHWCGDNEPQRDAY